jgi:hypothetical protein
LLKNAFRRRISYPRDQMSTAYRKALVKLDLGREYAS